MGKSYCLAGVIVEPKGIRIVRPLLDKYRDAPVRNVGWSPWLLDGHRRWEIFELVGVQPADTQPPHVEDIWVRGLKPRRKHATPEQRRALLSATSCSQADACFGVPLLSTRSAAYLAAGTGQRSLATLILPARQLVFSASWREGASQADFRVALPVPGLGERLLPVKDHHLLVKAELAAMDLDARVQNLNETVQAMGDQVAVRIGLSRAFQGGTEGSPSVCWLLADGFFSLADPQP